ncbi:aromatic compound dioxygenase [Trichodelitschia bisporula]|uniref:Aromatic compound dioxygenase n=1 Tax=Trichodelitschia bisporula TaxID=703511 RepID=A0A6G1HQH3_9PEZI|nr:aromatic compound dioxygenase [Trichodelitschia bisporula]
MASSQQQSGASRFDPTFTQNVIDAMGPDVTPRNRVVFTALFKHLHDFAREVELTIDEWKAGMEFLDEVGHMYYTSDKKRHEMHRISDITGLESLVDEIAHKHASESGAAPTSSSILGPFWSPNAPFRDNGASIIESPHEGLVTKMHGRVIDLNTGKGIPGAVFDIWQASSNGKYDFQDPEKQVPNNLRGKFRCNEKGEYWFYCLRPTAYSLPTDGPSFALLNLLGRHPMRPAHIHLMISAPGYKQVVTQIFPSDDPWLTTDTVFAVKNDLVVDFVPLEGDPKATRELKFDAVLAPQGTPGDSGSAVSKI